MQVSPVEFIDCNLEQMRELYQAHASNILPNCERNMLPQQAVYRQHQGRIVTVMSITHFSDSEGEPVARIARYYYADGEECDYPLMFRIGKTVYNLTEW